MTYYDDIAEGYEELHAEEQQKKISLIKTFLKPNLNDKLLDVGCGTGVTTQPWNCIRFGIDPAKKLILRARDNKKLIQINLVKYQFFGIENFDTSISVLDPTKISVEIFNKKNIEYKISQAEKIPYPDNKFDYVISITAIQNFDDIKQGLKEIKRVGKTKFVLTALKKSSKISKIKEFINNIFDVKEEIEEDKDFIFRIGF